MAPSSDDFEVCSLFMSILPLLIVSVITFTLKSLNGASPTLENPSMGDQPKHEVSGSVEVGTSAGWASGAPAGRAESGHQWLVDGLFLNQRYRINPAIHFVFDNALAIGGDTLSPTASYNNSRNFFSTKAQFRRGEFTLANLSTYLDLRLTPRTWLEVGHLRVPLGLESLGDRWNILTYYYSNSFMAAQVFGWTYDLGAQLTLDAFLGGRFQLALVDGRHPSARLSTGWETSSPSVALRYQYDYGVGLALASFYIGKFRGKPGDVGGTLGTSLQSGPFHLNFEYLFTSTMTSYTDDQKLASSSPFIEYVGETTVVNPNLNILAAAKPGHRAQAWSIYIEPGIELGDIGILSAKYEYGNHEFDFAKEDMNIAVGFTRRWDESFQMRLVYQHFNLLGNLGSHANDIRLLIGKRF